MSITLINLESYTLNFYGPLKFVSGDKYLFDSIYSKSECIYLWVLKDEWHNINYLHYVGETVSFARRHREHLLKIVGMDYRVLDYEAIKRGEEKIVWDGLWRDRTPGAAARLIKDYDRVSKYILNYLNIIDVYLAPTNLETYDRRHVEGCIGWNLRNNHPEYKKFYPDDNHIGTKANRLGVKLFVNMPEQIAGIDREQIV